MSRCPRQQRHIQMITENGKNTTYVHNLSTFHWNMEEANETLAADNNSTESAGFDVVQPERGRTKSCTMQTVSTHTAYRMLQTYWNIDRATCVPKHSFKRKHLTFCSVTPFPIQFSVSLFNSPLCHSILWFMITIIAIVQLQTEFHFRAKHQMISTRSFVRSRSWKRYNHDKENRRGFQGYAFIQALNCVGSGTTERPPNR